VKPATVYGWQHCLDRWILPNLGNKLLSEVRNGVLRQFVEILSAAGLAPKSIVNVVTVVKLVVASAVDEEGDQIHPRIWNHEFIQLPLVIKEAQKRPTIGKAEVFALLNSMTNIAPCCRPSILPLLKVHKQNRGPIRTSQVWVLTSDCCGNGQSSV
jgi:hypothetical protein